MIKISIVGSMHPLLLLREVQKKARELQEEAGGLRDKFILQPIDGYRVRA